ncbi:MAG: macro domain-containing protein [Lachnospiraceae bacterium]|nr:macro domain-containing protein [Lachnospiraceae bacterium]
MPLQIIRNDITKVKADAIVNTANPEPGFGAGVDAAVYEAAGREKLLEKRREIGVIEKGAAVITEGFDLPAKYIIHAVGTAWKDGRSGEEDVIRHCYRSIFEVAVDNDIETLAIPLLASGSYGFPKGIALRIALSEIESFLDGHEMEILLVVFDEKAFALSSELYGDIDSFINDNYVEEKQFEEYRAPRRPEGAALSASQAFAGGAVEPRQEKRFFGLHKASEKKARGAKDASVNLYAEMGYAPAPCMDMASKEAAEETEKRSLDDVIRNLDKTFMELVFSFADERGMTDVEVQKRANLDRKAFSKLKCGTTKNPSKSTALALAVALKLNLDDTKDLLSRAGYALSPCSRQDVIVRYFIEKEAYDIYEINVALFEHGEATLGAPA